MMMIIIYSVIAFLVGASIGIILFRIQRKQVIAAAQSKSQHITRDARTKADDIKREADRKARDVVDDARRKFEDSVREKMEEARRAEQRSKDLEKNAERERQELVETKEKAERTRERSEKAEQEYQRLSVTAQKAEGHFNEQLEVLKKELEKVASMTQKEARETLMKTIEDDAKINSAKVIKAVEENTKDESEKLAKRIISVAISRYSSDYIPERTTSSVALPNDEMKGRLIGREGRNIRAIEAATGCDLIIDDTPETVIVSCFDPVRRHIGKTVLETLINDGRVHPSRIEEIVDKVTKNVDKVIKEAGEKACIELGILGMHPELMKVIGQLQFRFSYSQNQYYHVIEVGHLCGLMAAELGLDIKQARRAGLLHDIGKSVDHEQEGPHAEVGAQLARKHGESPKVCQAIAAHHGDEGAGPKPASILDHVVASANALSAARPGARREQLASYIKRLDDLEAICKRFGGVERAYALQAGREIRVMVMNDQVDDAAAVVMSKEIARSIENEATYPGQVRVVVVRETRASDYAK